MSSDQNSAGCMVRHSWSQHCSFKGCSALMAEVTLVQVITGQGLGWVVLPTMAQGGGGLIWDQRHLLRVSMIISLCKQSHLCTGPCVCVRQRSLVGYSPWGCKIIKQQPNNTREMSGFGDTAKWGGDRHLCASSGGQQDIPLAHFEPRWIKCLLFSLENAREEILACL